MDLGGRPSSLGGDAEMVRVVTVLATGSSGTGQEDGEEAGVVVAGSGCVRLSKLPSPGGRKWSQEGADLGS